MVNKMNDTQNNEFVASLVKYLPSKEKNLKDHYDFWLPDEPPFFSTLEEIGSVIAENLNLIEDLKGLFQTIENGMASDNNQLKEAVATGLLEALVIKLESRKGNYDLIDNLLGKDSKKHIIEWTHFCKTGKQINKRSPDEMK
jgi:hypothetical protein